MNILLVSVKLYIGLTLEMSKHSVEKYADKAFAASRTQFID